MTTKTTSVFLLLVVASTAACGTAGSGPEPGPPDCDVTVEEFCSTTACPESPDDVALHCGDPSANERRATSCGGTLVTTALGTGSASYYFDAQEQLIGVNWTSDDAGYTCGRRGPMPSVVGDTCEGVGEASNPCEQPSCSVQSLPDWCAPGPCPDLKAAMYCNGPAKQLQDNDCGGKNLSEPGALQGGVLSFDADGTMVGLRLFSDTRDLCDGSAYQELYGSPCSSVGEPKVICNR